jgi:predicted DNA-binding transcriptional regulator AlpA
MSARKLKLRAASADLDSLMDVGLTCAFLGGKSKMTIHRWMADETLGFPKPLQISGKNYWVRRDLLAFVERQRTRTRATQVSQPGVPPARAAEDSGIY